MAYAAEFRSSGRSWIREDWLFYTVGMLRPRRFRVELFVGRYLPFACWYPEDSFFLKPHLVTSNQRQIAELGV